MYRRPLLKTHLYGTPVDTASNATLKNLEAHYQKFEPTLRAIDGKTVDKAENLKRVVHNVIDAQVPSAKSYDFRASNAAEVFKESPLDTQQTDALTKFYRKLDIVVDDLKIPDQVLSTNPDLRKEKVMNALTDLQNNKGAYIETAKSNLDNFKTQGGDLVDLVCEVYKSVDNRLINVPYKDIVDRLSNYVSTDNFQSFVTFAQVTEKQGAETVCLLVFEHHLALALGFATFIALGHCLHETGVFRDFVHDVTKNTYTKYRSKPGEPMRTHTEIVIDNATRVTVGFITNYVFNQFMETLKSRYFPGLNTSAPSMAIASAAASNAVAIRNPGFSDLWGRKPIVENVIGHTMEMAYQLGRFVSGGPSSFLKGMFDNNQVLKTIFDLFSNYRPGSQIQMNDTQTTNTTDTKTDNK